MGLLLLLGPLQAQESGKGYIDGHDAALRLEAWYEDLPVVLSASRLQQPATTAAAAVTIIDRDMLAASGVRHLVDALRLVPGFYVGNLSGSAPAAAYHGLADYYSKRMQVLVDGVSIYSPLMGGVEWPELPLTLADIERIEVVRGPNAATFGANAFLAVINIITRDPATEPGFLLTTHSGSNGIRDLALSTSRSAEQFRYTLSYGHREDQGFRRLPDDHSVNLVNFRGFYRLTAQDELSAQVRASNGWYDGGQNMNDNFYQGGTGTGGGLAAVNLDPYRRRYVNQQTLQLRWTHTRNGDEELWVQLHHHQRSIHESLSVDLPLGGGLVFPQAFNFDARVSRDDIELQKTMRLGETSRLAWGAQYRGDHARSQIFLDSDHWHRADLQRLFANVEHQWPVGWTLHAGIMLEHNSLSGNSVSPRLAAVWQPVPHHTLRIGMARANRTPTINEEHGSMAFRSQTLPAQFNPYQLPLAVFSRSSGNLRDERILSRELAYAVEIPHWRASADLRVFSDRVENLILLTLTKPVLSLAGMLGMGNTLAWDYVNTQEVAHVRGAELSARWQPWAGAQWQLAGSWTDIKSAIPDSTQSAPTTTWSWLMTQALPQDMQLSLGWYRVAALKWQSAPLVLPRYETMDLRLARSWRMSGQRRLELAVVLRNVLGAYADYKPNAQQRHQGFVQLGYQF